MHFTLPEYFLSDVCYFFGYFLLEYYYGILVGYLKRDHIQRKGKEVFQR